MHIVSYLCEERLLLGKGNDVCNTHSHFQEAHCTNINHKFNLVKQNGEHDGVNQVVKYMYRKHQLTETIILCNHSS